MGKTAAKKGATKKTGEKRQKPYGNLTAQQEKFCRHYALHKNGAEAYGVAYPTSLKHDAQYRAKKANELLSKVYIRGRVEALSARVVEKQEQEFEITAERILQEMAAMAFANAGDYYAWGTRRVPLFTKKGQPILDKDGEQAYELVPYVTNTPSEKLTRTQLKAIAGASESISKTGDRLVEIKMADKFKALHALGINKGLFNKVSAEISGKGGAPVQILLSPAEAAL